MRKRFKNLVTHQSEFELDLAPLLAVMVKLVPVLLISSAFVHMMIIETELPQVIQDAIKKQESTQQVASITVNINKTEGVQIVLTEKNNQQIENVGLNQNKEIDYKLLHEKFIALKQKHPEIFKIDLNPSGDVAYKDIVKIMDEARKVRTNNIQFPVKDEKSGKETTTEYMFPEIVFSNTMDG